MKGTGGGAHRTLFAMWNNSLAPQADRLYRLLAEILNQTEQLLNTNLVILLHFLDAMGCDPRPLPRSILNAEGDDGATLPLYAELPIALVPRLSCTLRCHRHRRQLQWLVRIGNDLPVTVDKDRNYYSRFSIANSLGVQIPIFEDTSPSPSYCPPDLKVSATAKSMVVAKLNRSKA